MKLKLDDKGNAVLQDGKPIYVHDDGKEVAFDAPATIATIGRLNGEAKGHRERAEAAEGKLKGFEGIDDPDAARKALGLVKNLDEKKLLDAGKVDEIKAAAIAAVEEKYKPIVSERDKLKGDLDREIIGGSFSRSKYVDDKVAVPRHMLEKTYGQNFKVEDGKLVPYDGNGSKIFSRAKPGEVADFDEALEHLISADPFKDHILKGSGGGGGGSPPGGGGGAQGAKTIKREQFETLSAADRITTMKDKVTIVD